LSGGVGGVARAWRFDSAFWWVFLVLAPCYVLNGEYAVSGKGTEGMDVVDQIKRGKGPNGAIIGAPDVMTKVTVID